MRGKNVLRVTAMAVAMLFLAGAAIAAPKTIRLSHVTAKDSPWDKGAHKFAELVAKNTNGRIEVKVFPQSQLANGSQKAELEMLQSGVIDMTWDSPIILALFLDKRFDVFNLPWLYPSMEVANKVADGPMGVLAMKWLEEKGIVGLGIGVNGYRELTNSKHPITTPDDMKGIKFRVAGSKLYLDTFKLLGANAVTMSFGEVFTSLQQGVIDGQENPTAIIIQQQALRGAEVPHHVALLLRPAGAVHQQEGLRRPLPGGPEGDPRGGEGGGCLRAHRLRGGGEGAPRGTEEAGDAGEHPDAGADRGVQGPGEAGLRDGRGNRRARTT